ncbi:hypothetical protein GCM10020254_27740 [Streptomyces goshikiensis]
MEREPAEGALVDEAELGAGGVVETDPDPQVLLVGGVGGLYEQLPAHAEVAEHGQVPPREGQPEVLPPPLGHSDGLAPQPRGEVHASGGVPAHGPRVQHLDVLDGPPCHPALQSAPDDFDFGQLGHVGSSGSGADLFLPPEPTGRRGPQTGPPAPAVRGRADVPEDG